jgi:hypothetical protein
MTMRSAVSSCSRSSQLTGTTLAEQVRLQRFGDRLGTLQMLPYIGSYATTGRFTNPSPSCQHRACRGATILWKVMQQRYLSFRRHASMQRNRVARLGLFEP